MGQENAKHEVDIIASGKSPRRRTRKKQIPKGARQVIKKLLSASENGDRNTVTFLGLEKELKLAIETATKASYSRSWAPLGGERQVIPLWVKRIPKRVYLATLTLSLSAAGFGYIRVTGYIQVARQTQRLLRQAYPEGGADFLFYLDTKKTLIAAADYTPPSKEALPPDQEKAREALIRYHLLHLRDCSGLDMRGYKFGPDDNVSNVKFIGTDLRGAFFDGTNVVRADFSGADLRGAKMYSLHLLDVKFDRANLEGTDFYLSFLDGASVRHTYLSKIVSRTRLEIENGHFSLRFSGVDFSYAVLDGLKWYSYSQQDSTSSSSSSSSTPAPKSSSTSHTFTGASMKGFQNYGGSFKGANLEGADLSGSYLELTNFEGANLRGANLSGSNLSEANFEGADLNDAKFISSNLFRANMENALATGATFEAATMNGASVSGAQFNSANFQDASLRNLKGEENITSIDEANFQGADTGWSDFSALFESEEDSGKATR